MTHISTTEQRIFTEAIELPTEAERKVYLQHSCGADAALRQSVEGLLQAYFAEENFILPQVTADAGDEDSALAEGPGTTIGRYKLLEQIGEGGFGVVYMAEQQEPVRRRVALKIIKLGMDTRQVIARFEAERQALAMMDHPNIAKVLDAGATESGRPYFVMELVRGMPITRFCDENKFDTDQRLDLFTDTCSAIEHAHQKGIIHRDIKPSNILVTLHGDKAMVKVIDFGIAKATQQRLTEKTLFTHFQQFIGTPAYMSPEQASLSGLDIDTRSDIYSLGVLLYELLTGRTPFDSKSLLSKGYDEMRRIIREEEPPRPSTCLGTLEGEELTRAGKRRGTDPSRLSSLLRGDLDWIVIKAMEKDRLRRYRTVDALVDDLLRYRKDEPVMAGPPSAAYRIKKFVRRNRVGVMAGLVVATTLVAATVVSSLLAFRAIRAERGMTEEQKRTETEARRTRQQLYLNVIKGANQAVLDKNPGQALGSLEQYIPADEISEDLRGWEWDYLWNQVAADASVTLGTHETEITSAAFSPSGRLVASSDYAGNIQVWDFHGGDRVYLHKTKDVIPQMLFYSEEVLVVVERASGNVSFHDVRQGAQLRTLDLGVWVRAIALSPGRDQLAAYYSVGDERARVTVWSLSPASPEQPGVTLSPAFSLGTPVSGTQFRGALAYSPDGGEIAVAPGGSGVCIYDVSSGEMRRVVGEDRTVEDVYDLDYSADSRWLAVGQQTEDDSPQILVWSTSSWREVLVLPGHSRGVRGLRFSPEGDYLLTAGGDQVLRQWSTKDWSLLRTFCGHTGPLQTLALHPSGQWAVTGGNDARLLVWDLTEHSRRLEPVTLPGVQTLAFSPSGDVLAAVGTADEEAPDLQRVVLRAGPDSHVQAEIPALGDSVTGVAFTADGKTLAALSPDAIRLWDMELNKLAGEGSLRPSDSRCFAGFTADGQQLLLVDQELGGSAFAVLSWNVATHTIEDSWEVTVDDTRPGSFDKRSVAFHQDSGSLLLGASGRVMVWNVNQARRIGELGKPGVFRVECAVSPDGTLFATQCAGASPENGIWDASTMTRLSGLQIPPHTISAISFSPDGRRVAMGHYRFASIGIYDSRTGLLILTIPTGPTMVHECGWSPDGSALAAVGEGGGIIWRTMPRPDVKAQP
jgi:WD40 repeat protein